MKRNLSNLLGIGTIVFLGSIILPKNDAPQPKECQKNHSLTQIEKTRPYIPSESLIRALSPNYHELSQNLNKTYEILESQGMYPIPSEDLLNPSKKYMQDSYEYWKSLNPIQKDSLLLLKKGNFPDKHKKDSLQLESIKSKFSQ